LPLEISEFTLEGSVLPGVFLAKPTKLRANFAVPHQKDERDDGGGDQEDRDQKDQQLDHGHWASLGVRVSLSPC
jgi:hypothetical protein